jgi:hypothetical protein
LNLFLYSSKIKTEKFTGPNKVLLVLVLGHSISAHREDCLLINIFVTDGQDENIWGRHNRLIHNIIWYQKFKILRHNILFWQFLLNLPQYRNEILWQQDVLRSLTKGR